MSINHNYETEVAVSYSVNKTCVKRPIADKSRSIPDKFFYGSLSGSHES